MRVVIHDRPQATGLAKELTRAAASRVLEHEPLVDRSIDANPNALVVGAGTAGIAAALTLAQKGRHVTVVERAPGIGGHVVQYGELAPKLECAPCVLEPLMDSLLHDDGIRVLTHAEVDSVVGSYGNFTVTVNKRARFVDPSACIGCGACVDPCPVEVSSDTGPFETKRRAMHSAWKGALPNVPLIDGEHCLRFRREAPEPCEECRKACAFDAVKLDQRDEKEDIHVGACVVATGFKPFDARSAPQYGYGTLEDVYTNLDMEEMLSKNGCTQGSVRCRDGRAPKRVAIVHCVGSLSPRFNDYCSGVCCLNSVKIAHLLRHQLTDVEVTELHGDLVIGDKHGQGLLRKVQQDPGVRFVRVAQLDALHVTRDATGLHVAAPGLAAAELGGFDMVVLATGLEGPRGAIALAKQLDIVVDAAGFFQEANTKLDPAGTTAAGVMIAGCAQWPKNIEGSVAQAQAAAGKILSKLVPGERLAVSPEVAAVLPEACSGCRMCIGQCPYRAISIDFRVQRAVISDTLCMGCGVCAASCPSQAIVARHSTDAQLMAELKSFFS